MKTKEKVLKRVKQIIYGILWIGLIFFAFRKVNKGLDLWDTGYNLANFQWMGTEHMDNMWLFSTYLSNAVGHIFSLLPGGKTLLGMNIYTTGVTVLLMILSSCFFGQVHEDSDGLSRGGRICRFEFVLGAICDFI